MIRLVQLYHSLFCYVFAVVSVYHQDNVKENTKKLATNVRHFSLHPYYDNINNG